MKRSRSHRPLFAGLLALAAAGCGSVKPVAIAHTPQPATADFRFEDQASAQRLMDILAALHERAAKR
jgi:hypothetical protein